MAAVIALMLLVISALVAVSLISIRSNIVSEDVNSKKALFIAEAGLQVAKHTLRGNWASYSDPDSFPLTSFAGGTFDAAVTPTADPTNEVIITVTGTYSNSKRAIQSTVSRYADALDNAIFTSGDCNLNGNVAIDGDVMYGGTYVQGGSVSVTGSVGQSDQPLPGLDSAAAIAQARASHLNGYDSRGDGNYFQGDFDPKPDSLNGVIFIDKYPSGNPANVDIASNISTDDENPALLIVMGDLRISGNVHYRGLIYAAGVTDIDISLLGNMTLDGALLTSGDVIMRGNAEINYDEDLVKNSITGPLLTSEDMPQERTWQEVSP
jgi:hypothetical protein